MRSEQAQSKCFLGRLCLPFLGALFVLASLPLFATEALALQVNVQRVAGDTRYDTMSELISNVGGWSASDKVILASGTNYPDALSASALAGVHDAPIILTDPTELSSKAAATIKQLGPSTIYVVGGPSAVSDAALQAASNICGSNTIRLYGSTRYETSLEILRQCNSSSDTVIVATGANYADSLSISPFAYVTKSPIVLCDPYGGITQEAVEAIRAGGFSRAILVGGNAAVPDVVISQLNNANIATDGIRRLSGAIATKQVRRLLLLKYRKPASLRQTRWDLRLAQTTPTPLQWDPAWAESTHPFFLLIVEHKQHALALNGLRAMLATPSLLAALTQYPTMTINA